MPPIHWVKLRQRKRLWPKRPKSLSTVAPVVVNPETASKRASR